MKAIRRTLAAAGRGLLLAALVPFLSGSGADIRAAASSSVTPPQSQEAQPETPEPAEAPPVVWEPWSDEVFARAAREQKGVLLTVVTPWCRPCATADKQVYTDPVVRQLISRSWIPVRVDSMERPDLDTRYQIALAVLGRGNSGYPVTAFLFPTGEAMWADTFIPVDDREARPGMRHLLDRMDYFWKKRFPEAQQNALAVQQFFDMKEKAMRPATVDEFLFSSMVDTLIASHDPSHGGYGPPPRRQNAMAAELVLLASRRRHDKGLERQALDALRGPVRGGLFDPVEGGFHRATKEPDWSVPFLGKDLTVNAVYLHALTQAVEATGDEELAAAARKTIDYILSTLRAPSGGFLAAQAPSQPDQEELSYYAYKVDAFRDAVDDETLGWAKVLFGFSDQGDQLLGRPPRFLPRTSADSARAVKEAGLDAGRAEAEKSRILDVLTRLRKAKTPPPVVQAQYLDTTCLAASSLLSASSVLGDARASDAALAAIDAILDGYSVKKGVPHRLDTKGPSPVLMEDQGYLGNALLDAYEHTGKSSYLEAAGTLADTLISLFDAPGGAFYDVIDQPEAAGYARMRREPFMDSVTASPQVVAATFLERTGRALNRKDLADRAGKALAWTAAHLTELDERGTSLALAVDDDLHGRVRILVDGEGEAAPALRRAALELYEPAKLIITETGASGKDGAAKICLESDCIDGLTTLDGMQKVLVSLRARARNGSASPQASP